MSSSLLINLSAFQTESLSRDSTLSSYSKLQQDTPITGKGYLSSIEAIKAYDEPINYYKGDVSTLKNNFVNISSNKPKYISDSLSDVLNDGTYSVSKNIVLDGSSFNDKAVAKLINKPVQKEVDSGIFGMFGKHEYHEERGMEIHMNGMPDKKANEVGKADKGRGYKLLDRMTTAFRRTMSPSSADIKDSMSSYDTYLNTGYKSNQTEVYTTNTVGRDVINFIKQQEDNSLTGMFYEWKNTGATAGMKSLEGKFSEIIVPEKFSHSTIVGGKVRTIFNDLPAIKYSPEAYTHIHSKTMWSKDTIIMSTGNMHTLYKQSESNMGWGWYDQLKDVITGGNTTKGPAQQNFAIKIKDDQAVLQMNRVKDILMSKGKTPDGVGYMGLTKAELNSVYKGVDPGKRLIFGGAGTDSLETITGHLSVVKEELNKKGKKGTIYVTGPYISDMGDNQFVDMVAKLARQGHTVKYIAQHPNSKEAGGYREGSINTISKLQQAGVQVLVAGDLNGSYLAHFKGFYSLEGSVLTSHNLGGASNKSVFEAGAAIYDKDINQKFVDDLVRLEEDNKLIDINDVHRQQSWVSRIAGRGEAFLSGFSKGWGEAENLQQRITKPIGYALNGLISGRDYTLKIKESSTNVERNISNPQLRGAYMDGYGITLPSKMNPSYFYAKAVYNRKMNAANFGEYSVDRYTRGPAASLYIHSYTAKNGTTPGNIPDSIRRFDEETQSGGLGMALNIWGIENGYGRIMREELGVIGSAAALVGRMFDQSMSFYTQEMHDPYYFLDQLDGNEHGFSVRDPAEGLLEGAMGHGGKMLQGALYSAMVYVSIGEPINLFISHLFKTSIEDDLTKALEKDAGLKLKAISHSIRGDGTKFFGLDNPFNNMSLTLNHLFLRKRGHHLLTNLVIPFLHDVVNPYTNHNDRKAYLNMAYKIANEIEEAPDIKISNIKEFENFADFKATLGNLSKEYTDSNNKTYKAISDKNYVQKMANVSSYEELTDYYETLNKEDRNIFNSRMNGLFHTLQFEIKGLGISRQMTIARSLQDILDETPLNPFQWGGVRKVLGLPTHTRATDGGYNAKFFSVGNVLSFEDITRNIETMLTGRGGFNKLLAKYHYVDNTEALANSIKKLDNIDLNKESSTSQEFHHRLWGKLTQASHLTVGIALDTLDGFGKSVQIRNLINKTSRIINQAEANLGPKLHLVTGMTYLKDRIGIDLDAVYEYMANPTIKPDKKAALVAELNRIDMGGRRVLSFEQSGYDILEATQQQTIHLLDAAAKADDPTLSPAERQLARTKRLNEHVKDLYDVVSVTDAKKISAEYGMHPHALKRRMKADQYIKSSGMSYKQYRALMYNGVAALIAGTFIAKQLLSLNEGTSGTASLITTLRASVDFAKQGDHSTEINVNRIGLLEGLGNLVGWGIGKAIGRDPESNPLNIWGHTFGDIAIGAGVMGQLAFGYIIAKATEGVENRKYVFNITKTHSYFKDGAATSTLGQILGMGYDNSVREGSLLEEIGNNRITIMGYNDLDNDFDKEVYSKLQDVHDKWNVQTDHKSTQGLVRAQDNLRVRKQNLVKQLSDIGLNVDPNTIGENVEGLRKNIDAFGKNSQAMIALNEYEASMDNLRRAAIDYDGILAIKIDRGARTFSKGVNMVFTKAGMETFNSSAFVKKGGVVARTIMATAALMIGANLFTNTMALSSSISRELTGSFDPFVGGLVLMTVGGIAGKAGLLGRATGGFPKALKVGKGAGIGLLLGIAFGSVNALTNDGGIFKANKANKVSNAQMVGLVTNLENFSNIVLERYANGDPSISKQELSAALYAKFISSSVSLSEPEARKSTVESRALQSPFHFIQFFVAQRKEVVFSNGLEIQKRTFSAGMQGPPISGLSFSFMLPFIKYEYVDPTANTGNKLGVYNTGYMANQENDIADLYRTSIEAATYVTTFAIAAKGTEEILKAAGLANTNHISEAGFRVGKFILDGGDNITAGVINTAAFLFGNNYRYIEDIRRAGINNLDTNYARHMARNKIGLFSAANKKTMGLVALAGGALGFLLGLSNEQLISNATNEFLTTGNTRRDTFVTAAVGGVIGAGIWGGTYFTQATILNHFNMLNSGLIKDTTVTEKFVIKRVNQINKVSKGIMNSKATPFLIKAGLFAATIVGFHAFTSSGFGLYQDFDSTPQEHIATAVIAATMSTAVGYAMTSGFGGSTIDRAFKQAQHLQSAASATNPIKSIYHKFQAFRYRNAGTELGSQLDRNISKMQVDTQRLENTISMLESRLASTDIATQADTRKLIEWRIQEYRNEIAGQKAIASLDNMVKFEGGYHGSILDKHKAISPTVTHVVTMSEDQFNALNNKVGVDADWVEVIEDPDIIRNTKSHLTSAAARNAATGGAPPNKVVKLELDAYKLMEGSYGKVIRTMGSNGDLYVDLGVQAVSKEIRKFGNMGLTKSTVKALKIPFIGLTALTVAGRALGGMFPSFFESRLRDLELYQRDSLVSQVSSNLISLFSGADRKLHKVGDLQYWVQDNELQFQKMTHHSLSPAMAKANLKSVNKLGVEMLQEGLVLDDTNVFFSLGIFGVTASNKEEGDIFRAYVQIQGAGADVSATAYSFSASFMFRAIMGDAQQMAFVMQGMSDEVSKDMTPAQVTQVSMRILAIAGKLPPLKKQRQFITGLEDQLRTATGGKLVNMAIQDRVAETRRMNKLSAHAIFANQFRQAVYQQGNNVEGMLAMMLASTGDKEMSKDFWQILMALPGSRPMSSSVLQLGVSDSTKPFFINGETKLEKQLDVFYTGNYSLALQYKEQSEARNFLSGVWQYLSQTVGTLTGTTAIVAGVLSLAVIAVPTYSILNKLGTVQNFADNDIRLTTTDSYYNERWFYDKTKGTSKWTVSNNKLDGGDKVFTIKKGKDVYVITLPDQVPGSKHSAMIDLINGLSSELDALNTGFDKVGDATNSDSIYSTFKKIKGVYAKAGEKTPTMFSTIEEWVKANAGEKDPSVRAKFKQGLSDSIKGYLMGDAGIGNIIDNYVNKLFETKLSVNLSDGSKVDIAMGLLGKEGQGYIQSTLDNYEKQVASLTDSLKNQTIAQADYDKGLVDAKTKLQDALKNAEDKIKTNTKQSLRETATKNIDDILETSINDKVIVNFDGTPTINLKSATNGTLENTVKVLGLQVTHGLMMEDNSIFSILRHGFAGLFGREGTDSVGFMKALNRKTIGRLFRANEIETSEEPRIAIPDADEIKVNAEVNKQIADQLSRGGSHLDTAGKGAFKTIEIVGDLTDAFEIMGYFGNIHRLNQAAKHDRISDAELRAYAYDAGYSTVGLGISMAAAAGFTYLMGMMGVAFFPALAAGAIAAATIWGLWKMFPDKMRYNLTDGIRNSGAGKWIGKAYKAAGKGVGEGLYQVYRGLSKIEGPVGDIAVDLFSGALMVAGAVAFLKSSANTLATGTATKIGSKLGIKWLAALGAGTLAGIAIKNIVNPDAPLIPGFLYNASESVLKAVKDMPLIGYGYVEGYAASVEDMADYGPLERRTIKQKLVELSDEQAQLMEDIDGTQTLAYLMGDVFGRKTNMLNMESAYARGMVSSPRAQVSPQVRREMEIRAKLYAQTTFGDIVWRMRVENSKNAAAVLEKEASFYKSKVTQDIKDYTQTVKEVTKVSSSKPLPGKKGRGGKAQPINNNNNIADALLDLITAKAQAVLDSTSKKVNVTGVADILPDRLVMTASGAVNTAASYVNLGEEGEINIVQDGHELYTIMGGV